MLTAGWLIRAPSGAVAVALLAAAAGSFAALLWHLRRPGPCGPRRAVWAAGLVLVAVAVAVPPRGSRDVWSYAMYGRIVEAHQANPYRQAPAAFRYDPYFGRVQPAWRHTRSVYGPVFVGLAALGMRGAGTLPLVARLWFQLLAAGSLLAAAVIVDRRTRDPAAVAFVVLNPALVAVVNGAHNDLLVGLAVLGGAVLVETARPRSAGVVVGLGVLVKVTAVLPLVGLATWVLAVRGPRAAVGLLGAGAVVVAAGYGMAGGPAALGPLRSAATHQSRASVWHAPDRWVTAEARESGMSSRQAETTADRRVARWSFVAVAALTVAAIAATARRRSPHLVAGAAAFAYLLVAPYVLPWYAAWALPVFALVWRERLVLAALAQALLLLVAYRPPLGPALVDRILGELGGTVLPLAEVAAVVTIMALGSRSLVAHRGAEATA